jgi:hypothetical protein
MFLSDNRTEHTHLLHEETITLEIITDVREMDPNGETSRSSVISLIIWCPVSRVERSGHREKRQTN